jgi:hypothetical protein
LASGPRAGGNLTGFNSVSSELGAKGLALLHELVPGTETIGFLENPNNPRFEAYYERDVLAAATVIGIKIQILKARTDREIDEQHSSGMQQRAKRQRAAAASSLADLQEQVTFLVRELAGTGAADRHRSPAGTGEIVGRAVMKF